MRSKEVTLYHPPFDKLEVQGMVPPLVLPAFGAILKERGHNVRAIDARDNPVDPEDLAGCDVLLFTSVSTPQYRSALEVFRQVQEVKQRKGTGPVVAIGGAGVSYVDVREDGWDIICKGWGENVVGPLVEGEVNSRVVSGGVLSEEKLNKLPNPDWSLIEDLETYRRSEKHDPTLPVMFSRGCPHDCSFCSNESWRRTVRFYSPEKAISMVKDVHDLGVYQTVLYDDEALINHRNRVMKISAGIKPFNMRWRCNAHVNTVTSSGVVRIGMLDAISDAGCELVSLGVDGVDNEALRLFNKETTIKRCEAAIVAVKRANMLVKIYLIYPPGGSFAYTRKMEDFIRSNDPDFVGFSVQTPLPGSHDYHNHQFSDAQLAGMYYQSAPGVFGDVGLLNENDREALASFNQFLTSWREGKPKMPI